MTLCQTYGDIWGVPEHRFLHNWRKRKKGESIDNELTLGVGNCIYFFSFKRLLSDIKEEKNTLRFFFPCLKINSFSQIEYIHCLGGLSHCW